MTGRVGWTAVPSSTFGLTAAATGPPGARLSAPSGWITNGSIVCASSGVVPGMAKLSPNTKRPSRETRAWAGETPRGSVIVESGTGANDPSCATRNAV